MIAVPAIVSGRCICCIDVRRFFRAIFQHHIDCNSIITFAFKFVQGWPGRGEIVRIEDIAGDFITTAQYDTRVLLVRSEPGCVVRAVNKSFLKYTTNRFENMSIFLIWA